MTPPKTLQEIRDFYTNIPEDQWRKYGIGASYEKQHCAYGHLLHAFGLHDSDVWRIVNKLVPDLIGHNDDCALGPKVGVLAYIDSLIKQQSNGNNQH